MSDEEKVEEKVEDTTKPKEVFGKDLDGNGKNDITITEDGKLHIDLITIVEVIFGFGGGIVFQKIFEIL